jgi:hypothetical protein
MAVLALSACGGDSFEDNCEDACVNAAKCDGATQDESLCKSVCDAQIALNKASDCTDQANDYSECSSGINSCDTEKLNSECNSQSAAYRKCLTNYCVSTSDQRCSAQ